MSDENFSYDKSSLIGDYIRSALGIILTAGPVLFLELVGWLQMVFVICLILFVVFAIRTVIRQKTHYSLKENTLFQSGVFSKNLNFDELEKCNVRYFSTRKNRDAGWFQLKLSTKSTKIIVDSSLNGFDTIIKKAVSAANKNNLVLDEITSDNLNAILDPK